MQVQVCLIACILVEHLIGGKMMSLHHPEGIGGVALELRTIAT
jgi:hypothetical protein